MIQRFNLDNYDVNQNYAISASAGTGKTFNIVRIVKKILEQKNIDINKLLIVTYTEKAAGELKQRIRELCPNVDVDNASIGTIHSFCKDTIKEFSLSALKPTNLKVIDEDGCSGIIDQYLRDLDKNYILEYMGYSGYEIDDIKSLINEAMKSYYLNENNNEDKNIISLEITEDDLFVNDFIHLLNDLDPEEDDILVFLSNINGDEKYRDKYDEFRSNFNSILNSSDPKCIKYIETIKEEFINGDDISFKGFVSLPKPQKEYFKKIREIMQNCKVSLNNVFLYDHLKNIYIKWQEEKQKNKSQTFNDMIRFVRENINNGGELKRKLQEKYSYAIIDEFQDTNKLQWDIFRNVFMEDDNHHIIVVGDKKQSIYAFQGADVNVYEEAVKEIEEKGGIVASLNKNYRSSKNLVDMYNELFKRETFFDDYEYVESNDDIYAIYDGKKVDKPLYTIISDKNNDACVDENEYANYIADFIADCCSYNADGETTKLQLHEIERDKNHNIIGEKSRNVTFKDFAILGRTRAEFIPVERAMKMVGIPFTRYKDNSLFTGLECSHWIALLSAINKTDFTGRNRDSFKKALYTRFFDKTLGEISSSKYDKDDSDEMTLILRWKALANLRRWDELFESIIIDSKIEERMANLNDIQSINVFRQIGEYCFGYLNNKNTLEDLIEHLTEQSHGIIAEEDQEENSSIVGKGTDFDCVNVMTIHASKGLEFPIVISTTGFKGNYRRQKVFNYHKINEDDNIKYYYLSGSNKDLAQKELALEWIRLYYVSFTRPKYMLLLPYYSSGGIIKNFQVYSNIMDDYVDNSKLVNKIIIEEDYKINKNTRRIVSNIIKINSNLNKFDETSNVTIEEQKERINKLIFEKRNHMSFKHSYSSLSHPIHDDTIIDGMINANKEGNQSSVSLSEWDKNSSQINTNYNSKAIDLFIPTDYPKGARIGTALHEIFELFDFKSIDHDENKLDILIRKSFKNQGYTTKDTWLSCTKEMVYRVLNAKLIKIEGSNKSDETFKLKEIDSQNRKAEVEFNFNAKEDEYLKNYCNGFVDLIFRNGEYYSILDWKSDKLNDDTFTSYSNPVELKNHVDELYSIQRVLYAYCLIKWLKNFYTDLTEEEIFNKHFGGVYYVFLRGCSADTGNGIYAQTWDSYETLRKAFANITYKKMGGK